MIFTLEANSLTDINIIIFRTALHSLPILFSRECSSYKWENAKLKPLRNQFNLKIEEIGKIKENKIFQFILQLKKQRILVFLYKKSHLDNYQYKVAAKLASSVRIRKLSFKNQIRRKGLNHLDQNSLEKQL